MDISEWRDWLTFAGAVGAGITGVLNLWWKATEKTDKIRVGMGTIGAEQLPQTMLHVVSRSDHPIVVADYGFIRDSGELMSLPEYWEECPYEMDGLVRGEHTLASRNASFEAGIPLGWRAVGCYARTSSQGRVRLAFRRSLAIHRRAWLTLLIRLRGD